ncbi:ATP-binding cassette domain-containing protein [Acuticoccus sp. MNP-M23]|uniref:peptidase domain-containing ABC transporter n=1 Tax=Acuticoccus sp. MNP-M23 TaxID=3072793 RepID=UPI002814C432|nr:ATP-binding cassette domain-containing protein [Acuticoccus sp. MNP-M23]WMS40966.1 ATP-binding cassette domain-containing protein [Acuticoccus sp. MNP-M23]
MNAPINAQSIALVRPVTSRVPVPPPTASPDKLSDAIEALYDLLKRSRPTQAWSNGVERLFCALVLMAGVDWPIRKLAAALPADEMGLDVSDIVCAMGTLGFRGRPERQAHEPGFSEIAAQLVVPKQGEAFVLYRDRVTQERMALSRCGRTEPLGLARHDLTGAIFWTFDKAGPSHPLSEEQRKHTGHGWFRSILGRLGGPVTALAICTLSLALLSMTVPIFTIQTYANVIGLGSLDALPGLVAGMLILLAFEAVLMMQRGRIVAFLANRLEYLIVTLSFERLVKLRPALSQRMTVTDQASRLRSFDSVRAFMTSPTFSALLEAPASLVSIILVAILGGWIAIVPAAGIALHLCVFASVRRWAKVKTNRAADDATNMQRIAIETFEKRESIRDAGISHVWSRRVADAAIRQQRTQYGLRLVGATGEALSAFVLTATAAMLLVVGAQGVWSGTLGPGALLAVIMLGVRSLAPFHMLCLSLQRCEQVRNSVRQLDEFMEIAPERAANREDSITRDVGGGVTFLNAGHRYTDTRPLFLGLNLDVAAGGVIAITGASGSGKTTILKMTQGMVDQTIGTVRIDGVDIRQFELSDLRRRIAYVRQDPTIFPGTLRENLLLANPLARPQDLARAVGWARLDDDIAALADGLDTPLGAEEIETITQSFRTRFAIAQAILVDSRLMLIDEIPNAVLEGGVGDLIRQLLTTARNGRTVFFVTQRPDFLALADKVVVLRYANQAQVTTPADLLGQFS